MILLIYGHTLLAAYSLYLAFLTGTLNADQSMLNFEIRLKSKTFKPEMKDMIVGTFSFY